MNQRTREMHSRRRTDGAWSTFGTCLAISLATLTSSIQPAAATKSQAAFADDLMLSRNCAREEKCFTTWTLTSRLGDILETYEARFGARARTFDLLGIEFTTAGRPRVWYPDFGSGTKSIIIQLTQSARSNRKYALFQLAHEAFHLIEPIKPGSRASMLEEGLASFFAIDYVKSAGLEIDAGFVSESGYREALGHVRLLAKLHGDLAPPVRRLREIHRSFSRLTGDDIRAVFPNTPARIATELAKPFPGK